YEVAATAAGYRGDDAPCTASANGTACTLYVQAQYEDGAIGRLSDVYKLGLAANVSHTFSGTTSTKKITGLRGVIHGYQFDVTGPWIAVSDPYPDALATLVDVSLSRTGT